ncbi:MAG: hypothetical protein EB147_09575, partial [Acidimicrobiia bacterium]|nr:hypothetical protein [Acidimicrobiia bacterium]
EGDIAGANGITLARDVTFSGRGPTSNQNSGGLISIGYNTFTGTIGIGSASTDARMWSAYGTTTLAGNVLIGGTGQNTVFQGNGNWTVTGLVGGAESSNDRFIKVGNLITTTLWLRNSGNTFAQSLRIDNGTVRVQAAGALGANITTTALDLNNGTLEIRSDALAGFATRNLSFRDNTTGAIFVDHDVTGPLGLGSAAMNQTLSANFLRTTATNGATLVFNGRNGYGYSFGWWALAGNGSTTLTNSTSGQTTITGNINFSSRTSASTLTLQGGGDWSVAGLISASGALHAFTKAGSGLINFSSSAGTLSTFTGNASLNDGVTRIRSVDLLNNTSASAGRIVFGGGALSFVGAPTTGAGETWTNKVLDLNGNAYVQADQTGSAPTALVLPNNFAASSTSAKTFSLGGVSAPAVINQVTGLLTNTRNLTSVTKYGSNTWEIQAPTSYGSAGTLSIAATGTSATTTVVLASGTTTLLRVGQPISGVGIPVGATIAQIFDSSTIILSDSRVASSAADAAVAVGVASGIVTNLTATAASTGTTNPIITLASTANLVPGQKVTSANLPASQNWYIRDITSATTVTLVSGIGSSITAGAVLLNEVITPQASPNFGGNLTISNGILQATATSATSDIINSTSNLTFATDPVTLMGNAGGTFTYVGFSGGSTEVLGRLTPTAGHGVVTITNGATPSTLTFLDLGTRGAGATLDFKPGTGTIGFNGTSPTLTNSVLPGYATFNGVDFVTLSGSNIAQYTGQTAWSGALAPT